MALDQSPAIEITIVKDGIRVDLKGDRPHRFGEGNIMFPSQWTEEQIEKWKTLNPRKP